MYIQILSNFTCPQANLLRKNPFTSKKVVNFLFWQRAKKFAHQSFWRGHVADANRYATATRVKWKDDMEWARDGQ